MVSGLQFSFVPLGATIANFSVTNSPTLARENKTLVAKSRTGLSDFTFTFYFHALEKEMATHSSIPAWRIPGTEEPNGLLSMGSHRVGHDWSDLAAAAAGGRRISTTIIPIL